jgi:hypothetical protein
VIFGIWVVGCAIFALVSNSLRLTLLRNRTEKALGDNLTVCFVPWWPWLDGMLKPEAFKERALSIKLGLAALAWFGWGFLWFMWSTGEL